MIVDTSAAIAVLLRESDARAYSEALAIFPCRMSVANFLEVAIVLESRVGTSAGNELDSLIAEGDIVLEPVTLEQAQAARRAWRRFGKGNHPTGLNFGDCFAYALAETTSEPLLYKGSDFGLTDVRTA